MGSLYDYNTKASWDDLYEIDAESAWGSPNNRVQIDLNYHRFTMLPRDTDRVSNLKRILQWDNTSRVHFVECGFGWVLEGLAQLGVINTSGSSTSEYIQNTKTLNEDIDLRAKVEGVGLVTNTGDGLIVFNAFRMDGGARSKRSADILNEDLNSNQSRQRVRDRIGGPGYDVVTWDGFLNSHTDAEAIALSNSLNRMPGVGRVVHHVYNNWLNTHTLDEWKVLIPNDFFIEAVTWNFRE